MKEKLKRIRGVLILLLLMVLSANSHLLMSVATDDNLQEREIHATAKIETSLEKYINYDLEGQKGELVQLGLDASIEYETEEDKIPLQATGILLNVPQIENAYPQSVKLIAKSTMLTNGSKNGKDYKCEYDSEKGQVKIIAYNKIDEQGNYYSQIQENAKDSFSLILNYGEEAYNSENIERKIQLDGQLVELAANKQKTKFKANIETEYTVTEDKSSIISSNITSNKIYNGYIKSNITNETNYATNYAEVFELNISKEKISDEIQINLKNALEKAGNIEETDQVIYTASAVNKEEAFKILGENGYIKAIDQEGNTIGEITSKTEADANGVCKINYTENQGKLTLVVSKPETVGNLKIQNNKQIKSTMKDLDVSKVVQLQEIKCVNKEEQQVEQTNEETGETETITKTVEKEIYKTEPKFEEELRDSKTKVKLEINKTDWTNERQNEVEFELELCNNKSKYNLFGDFEATIALPEETEKVILDKENLMYANGLQVEKIEYNKDTKQINIKLVGTQTKYNAESLEKGTTLTIPAVVILSQNIEEKEINLTATYKNQNSYTRTQETGSAEQTISLHNFTQELTTNNDVNTQNNGQQQNAMQSSATMLRSAPIQTVETAEGIELEVKAIRGDAEITEQNPEVYEGEFIKYEITAKNTTSNEINDVKIAATLPEGVKYGELVREDHKPDVESYYDFDKQLGTIELGSISAGKTKSTYFEVQVNDLPEGETQKQISTTIKSYIGNALTDECTLAHVVKEAEYKVFLGEKIFLENEFKYILKIEGDSSENVDVNVKLPACMKATEVYSYNDTEKYYKQLNKESEFDIELKPGEYLIYANLNLNDLPKNNDGCTEIKAFATVNNKYKSNENRILAEYYYFEVAMDSENKGTKVKEGEEINYEIKISLKGKINYSDSKDFYKYVKLVDFLPDGVKPLGIVYNNFELNDEYDSEVENSQKYIETKNITEDISTKIYGENGQEAQVNIKNLLIPTGETITVNVKTIADRVIDQTKIDNMATVSEVILFEQQDLTSSITQSNTVSHIILPYDYSEEDSEEPSESEEPIEPEEPSEPETPENPEESTSEDSENKYSISGYVWNDQNGDGKKQENEQTINGIQTYLMDLDGNVEKIVTSGNDGSYTFSDIKNENYIVVFRYNTDKYNITKYKANGVSEELNSNAQKQKITIQDDEFVAGISDEIALNKNISNINLGLIENENQKFDIKVESYINKVTVKTVNETTEKNYDNVSLAKTEIKAKEVEGATVEVEYKIVITNNGDIAGTINSIVDIIPQGFDFNNITNANWNKNNDGTIVNTSLANEKLEAGKSKELTLVLTKELTENSTGTYTNIVKLEGLNNSLNSNEINTSNNTSKTELIVSISTGIAVYVIISIIFITVLLIVLNIKFNIFSKLKIRFIVVLFTIGMSVFMCSSIKSVKAESMADEFRRKGCLQKDFYLTSVSFGDPRIDDRNYVNWYGNKYELRYRWEENYRKSVHKCAIVIPGAEVIWLDAKPGWFAITSSGGSQKSLIIVDENGNLKERRDCSGWSEENWRKLETISAKPTTPPQDRSDLSTYPQYIYFERDWRTFLCDQTGQDPYKEAGEHHISYRSIGWYLDGSTSPGNTDAVEGICLDYDRSGGDVYTHVNGLNFDWEWFIEGNVYHRDTNAALPLTYTWDGEITGSYGSYTINEQNAKYNLKGNTGDLVKIKQINEKYVDKYVLGPFKITQNTVTDSYGTTENNEYTFSIKLKNGATIWSDEITACRNENGGSEYTKYSTTYQDVGTQNITFINKNTNFYLKVDKSKIENSRWYCKCNCI